MTASAFKSFQEQSLNYFIREHSHVPTGPIEAKSAWRGEVLRSATDEWLFDLNGEELAELSVAVDKLIARGVPLAEVSSTSLSLPLLQPRLLSWREAIKSGLGFVVLRGLPVDEWGAQKSSMAYWGIGHYLGFPGAQIRRTNYSGTLWITARRPITPSYGGIERRVISIFTVMLPMSSG